MWLDHRYARGDTVRPRKLTTIHGERIALPDPERMTHLQFRRYAGCPICNRHLHTVVARHDEIVAAGVRVVAVFHSTAADMRPHHGDLPFDCVADPDRLLYSEFGVETSARAVLHPRVWTTGMSPRTWPVVLRGLRGGGRPTPTHGETILGLPADLFIDPDGLVRSANYGRHANDQWTVDQVLRLAAE
jgi:peroxiredoxin